MNHSPAFGFSAASAHFYLQTAARCTNLMMCGLGIRKKRINSAERVHKFNNYPPMDLRILLGNNVRFLLPQCALASE